MKNILLKNKLKECLGERLILSSKGPEKLTFIFFLFFDWNQSISSPPDTAVVTVYGIDLLWPKDRYSAYWVNFKIHALHQGLAQKWAKKKGYVTSISLNLKVCFLLPSLGVNRLRVVPHFSSGIVERAKRERAWKSPHARKGDTRRGERKNLWGKMGDYS